MMLHCKPREISRRVAGRKAFSLAEVVIALGLCVFVLVALIGLFSAGLRLSRESEGQIRAANAATQLITAWVASPTSGTNGIPSAALTQSYGDAFGGQTNYLTEDGIVSTSPGSAAFRITCNTGTNASTGSKLAQIYLLLTWPPQAAPANAAGRYEVLTYVPLP
jgi:Tfp pilus assembly protein PilV